MIGKLWKHGRVYLKRYIAILLSILLLITPIFGCDTGSSDDDNSSDSLLPEYDGDYGYDFERAFAAFPPDIVMIYAGDYTVTWEELFVHLMINIINYTGGMSYHIDWDQNPFEGSDEVDLTVYTETLEDYIMHFSVGDALIQEATYYGASLMGISITDAEMAELMLEIDEMTEFFGGEEAFLALLWDEGFPNIEIFTEFYITNFLKTKIYEEMFGKDLELLTDEQIDEFVNQEGFMLTKHIFRFVPTHPRSGSDDPKGFLEDILVQLDEYDGDDFDAFFDELMYEHSEDTGMFEQYPDGFLFLYDEMFEGYSRATDELEIGEYSDIVTADYGYYIIYRIPVTYDIIPEGHQWDLMQPDKTLREAVAQSMFDYTFDIWRESLPLTFTPEFESIELDEIFIWYGLE